MYGSHRHLCGAGGAAAVFETVATHNSKPASGPLSTHKTALYSIAIVLLAALPGTMQTLAQQPAQQQSAQQPSTQQPGAQPAQSQAGQIPMLQPPSQGFTYPERQTLIYTVDWRVFTAGTAVFHLEQQGDVQKITASGDSVGAVTMLFPVVDTFQAGFNTRTGCSTGFSKQLLEGRRRVSSDLTFDYAAGRQHQVEKNLVKGTQKEQTASIPACVTDSLSAIFYAASQPMVVGQSFKFPLADSMRTVTVTMKVEAKEEIKTPAGTFQTIRVQPTADEGIVKNRGNIWIWYTDDARHMPVQIRARLFWGTITAHLQSYDAK